MVLEIFSRADKPYGYQDWTNSMVRFQVEAGYQHERPSDCPVELYDTVILSCFKKLQYRPTFNDIVALFADNAFCAGPTAIPRSVDSAKQAWYRYAGAEPQQAAAEPDLEPNPVADPEPEPKPNTVAESVAYPVANPVTVTVTVPIADGGPNQYSTVAYADGKPDGGRQHPPASDIRLMPAADAADAADSEDGD